VNVRSPVPEDLAEVLALCRAYDIAIYGDSDWTEADLREEWEADLDLEQDAWIVELDGRIAGYGTFDDRGAGRLMGDGYVHPALRGRGVGSRLVDLYEARAGEVTGGKTLESATLVGDGAADDLFRSRGFEPVRHFWRMVVEHDQEPPAPVWPEGVAAAPFDLADADGVHAVLGDAFAQEWGHSPQALDDFLEKRLGSPRFDPSLCWVARDAGVIAGVALNDWKRHGDWGWIGSLGVRPAWRRRGLGEALLRASLCEFFRRGERRVALGVDAGNATGATRLYERVGMQVLYEVDLYRKPLDG
jgi:mycothiol synthase